MAEDILFLTWHLSGGNNVNPDMALGGKISPHEIDATKGTELFSPANYIEAENGTTKYRCIYIKNNSISSEIKDTKLWLNITDVQGGGQSFELGYGGQTDNATPIDHETTAPTGVTFQPATDETSAVTFDLPAGATVAIWVKNDIAAGTEYYRANMNFKIRGTIYL